MTVMYNSFRMDDFQDFCIIVADKHRTVDLMAWESSFSLMFAFQYYINTTFNSYLHLVHLIWKYQTLNTLRNHHNMLISCYR